MPRNAKFGDFESYCIQMSRRPIFCFFKKHFMKELIELYWFQELHLGSTVIVNYI